MGRFWPSIISANSRLGGSGIGERPSLNIGTMNIEGMTAAISPTPKMRGNEKFDGFMVEATGIGIISFGACVSVYRYRHRVSLNVTEHSG